MATVVRDLSVLAAEVEKFRVGFLLEDAEGPGCQVLGPISEQHYLLALNALEEASRLLKIGHVHAMRGD